MKAVICDVSSTFLDERRRTGVDRWDAMWDGVLHMPPMPNADHQDLEGALESWLRIHWAPRRGAKVFHQIHLAEPGGWPQRNYRIPDLVLLERERFAINRNESFEGAPNVVVEIRSPGDESLEKLAFYARLGVPEVWIIDRDTKVPEVFVLTGDAYGPAPPRGDGWVLSEETGIELRAAGNRAADDDEPVDATRRAKLAVRLARDVATEATLPS